MLTQKTLMSIINTVLSFRGISRQSQALSKAAPKRKKTPPGKRLFSLYPEAVLPDNSFDILKFNGSAIIKGDGAR